MNKTKIEYLTHTWNPIAMRCTPVSAGCANCWHLAMAKRLAKNPLLDECVRSAYDGGIPALDNEKLKAPLHLKKPARIGVQFMGDLFHKDVPDVFISQIWQVMAECRQHAFFLLTKRSERVPTFLEEYRGEGFLGNVWPGVSIEDQKTADEQIPILLQIPAAHRWVSVEPTLGQVDLCNVDGNDILSAHNDSFWDRPGLKKIKPKTLDWVVLGGETGPHARPLHPDWVRSARDQCQAAGVPFFFKSWGEFCVPSQIDTARMLSMYDGDRKRFDPRSKNPFRFGRGKSGCLLDGREWKEIPE